ncbi:MAG: asparagine synthase (glutamine-hydrolyzing), partial [Methyloligellaceae bacterium]
RKELVAEGVTFRSESDTEVLLALFVRDGVACLRRLQGIFAFAVWDKLERRLLLARDHLGVKPLYYAITSQGFLFASELKALTLCPDLPRELNTIAVADHMGFIWTAGEDTMIKAVRKLRPGCVMQVDHSGTKVDRYYRVPLPQDIDTVPDASPRALSDLLDEVVRDQMVADVKVGALLSGGVDSSAIVASMCQATDPQNITTFCAAVMNPQSSTDNFGDDQSYARTVAKQLGVSNVEVPTEADLVDDLPGMIWDLDEPTADFAALLTFKLAQEARRNGIKVLLSGVGGDDLFTGYGRHTLGLIYSRLKHMPSLRRAVGRVLAKIPPTTLLGRRLQRIGMLLCMDQDQMLTEAMSFSGLTAKQRSSVLMADIRADAESRILNPFEASLSATEGQDIITRFVDLELNGFSPDHNLNYTDKMAMIAGVEVRVPLVDTRLVEYAIGLPTTAKIDFRRTKKILRQSQEQRLPEGVLTRAKQGFGFPVRGLLKDGARPLLEELTSPGVVKARGLFDSGIVTSLKSDFFQGRTDAALTLFPIMAIELWCRALDAAPTAR